MNYDVFLLTNYYFEQIEAMFLAKSRRASITCLCINKITFTSNGADASTTVYNVHPLQHSLLHSNCLKHLNDRLEMKQ